MSALGAELEDIDLGDRRLNRRARKVLSKLGDKPTVSIPTACGGGWEETRGAYRLFDHPKVTAQQVLAPHYRASFRGFLNRKGDGFPGPQTIWIGLQRGRDFVLAVEATRAMQEPSCG